MCRILLFVMCRIPLFVMCHIIMFSPPSPLTPLISYPPHTLLSILSPLSPLSHLSPTPQRSWVAVDLGKGRRLVPTRYCIRHGASGRGNAIRNWELRAREKVSAVRWG